MTPLRLPLHAPWSRAIDGTPIDFVPVPGSYRPVGQCTLTHTFTLPEGFLQEDARYFICTEGVLARAEFTLNGEPVGAAGPFVPYRFELPAALLRDTNTLSATITDIGETFGPTPGRRFDAGLIRGICLERGPAAFIASVAFRYELNEELTRVRCQVFAEIDGETDEEVEVSLIGPEASGADGAGEYVEFALGPPLLWSPDVPHLYDLVVRLGEDEVVERVGFRRLAIRGSDFSLNGERLLLKGVCRHEFMGEHGYTPPEEEVRRDLERIKAAGFNYIRLVHSPQSASVPRIASELGLFVSEEPGACFHDLSDEAVAGPALEALRRMVARDRNCPSVFAWLIYNECLPNVSYARRAAAICRDLDPGRFVSMADCSYRHDEVKEMVEQAGLDYYGINRYGFDANGYVDLMLIYHDRPLVFTEWGGWWTQANRGVVRHLGDSFVAHAQEGAAPRLAGCSFWAWQDYEEHSRPEPWSVDGVTIEGLIDVRGRPKQDLHWLSEWCYAMDHPAPSPTPKVEVLLSGPPRAGDWQPISLDSLGDQSALAEEVASARRFSFTPPTPTPLLVGGVPFAARACTDPILLGPGREEVVIPIGLRIRRIAILGHVALRGGYPASGVYSVHHRDQEPVKQLGQPASHYDFVFEDGTETQALQHGVHLLRSNEICRWWKTAPRATETRPAVRAVLHPSFEILRYELWEHAFGEARFLKEIRWKLEDGESVQGMLAVSVEQATGI